MLFSKTFVSFIRSSAKVCVIFTALNMLLQLLIKYLYVMCMNDRCLLVKRLVQMKMVEMN